MSQIKTVLKEPEEKERSAASIILRKIYRTIMQRYKRQFFLIMGIIIFVLVLQILTLFPRFADPFKVYWEEINIKVRLFWAPSFEHPLGTTRLGEDYFTQILWAMKTSIIFGLMTAAISTTIAILVGVLGPFKEGAADGASSFLTNIAMVFPQIPFIIFMNTIFQTRSWMTLMLVIALFTWPWAARSIRSQVLTLRERNFVKVSRMSALGDMRIAFSEVFPNILSYILLVFCINFGIAIATEAGITMIGVGPSVGSYMSLGVLLEDAKTLVIAHNYNLWLTLGIVLTVIYILFFSIQASFINIFNPKTRENI